MENLGFGKSDLSFGECKYVRKNLHYTKTALVFLRDYFLEETIINVMADIAINIPITILVVKASPNTKVPTRIAVIGSNTPSTEAFVAPIFRVESAKVAVETIVGKIASPSKLNQSQAVSIPLVMFPSDKAIFARNTTAPTDKA